MKKSGLLLFLGVLAGLGLGLAIIISSQMRGLPSGPATGKAAPDFKLNLLGGQPLSLGSLKGKVVVVNFWATWCEPCKAEMPLFESAYQEYPDRLVILAVNDSETEDVVSRFVSDLGISFPVVLDSQAKVSSQYFIRAYPTSIFLDTKGVIRAQHVGVLNESLLNGYLEKAGIKP